jgi:hypothetical protein
MSTGMSNINIFNIEHPVGEEVSLWLQINNAKFLNWALRRENIQTLTGLKQQLGSGRSATSQTLCVSVRPSVRPPSLYIYAKESTWYPNCNTLWNPTGRSMIVPLARVTAKRYSSSTFFSLGFHLRKKKFRARSNFFECLRLGKSEIAWTKIS